MNKISLPFLQISRRGESNVDGTKSNGLVLHQSQHCNDEQFQKFGSHFQTKHIFKNEYGYFSCYLYFFWIFLNFKILFKLFHFFYFYSTSFYTRIKQNNLFKGKKITLIFLRWFYYTTLCIYLLSNVWGDERGGVEHLIPYHIVWHIDFYILRVQDFKFWVVYEFRSHFQSFFKYFLKFYPITWILSTVWVIILHFS